MNSPVISIITICRNYPDGLRRTLESIYRQEGVALDAFESIVVDGSDDDECRRVVSSFDGDWTIRYFDGFRSGVYPAMNAGVQFADGQWIQFLNAGDELADSRCLAEMTFFLGAELPSQWVVAETAFLDGTGSVRSVSRNIPHQFYRHLLGRQMHAHPSTLMRRDFLRSLGGFSEMYGAAGDFDLVVRAGLVEPHPTSWFRTLVHFEPAGFSAETISETPDMLHRIRVDRVLGEGFWWLCGEALYHHLFSFRWRFLLSKGSKHGI